MKIDPEDLARAQGIEEGLGVAAGLLADLAETMIEREREVKPGAKINWARRTRIKAYQVAGARIRTRLDRQRRILAKMETQADDRSGAELIRTAVEDLAL